MLTASNEGLSVVRLDDCDEEDGVPAGPADHGAGGCTHPCNYILITPQ